MKNFLKQTKNENLIKRKLNKKKNERIINKMMCN